MPLSSGRDPRVSGSAFPIHPPSRPSSTSVNWICSSLHHFQMRILSHPLLRLDSCFFSVKFNPALYFFSELPFFHEQSEEKEGGPHEAVESWARHVFPTPRTGLAVLPAGLLQARPPGHASPSPCPTQKWV